MTTEEIKERIDTLSNKAWNSTGEEKRARLHELAALYDELSKLEKEPYYTLQHKARIHEYLKENDHAEAVLLKMIQLQPKSPIAFYMLAEVRFDAGNYAGALEAFDLGVKHEFYADHRYELRAKINRALGNLEEAEKDQKIYDDYQAAEQAKWDDPNHYYHYK